MLTEKQARNQLGTPGGAKSFLRGAHIFCTMSDIFKLYPTRFFRVGGNFSRGGFTGLLKRIVRQQRQQLEVC